MENKPRRGSRGGFSTISAELTMSEEPLRPKASPLYADIVNLAGASAPRPPWIGGHRELSRRTGARHTIGAWRAQPFSFEKQVIYSSNDNEKSTVYVVLASLEQ